MEATQLQKGAKREMIATPFAAQLYEVDKALFEYRYRKQGQQHQFNNTRYGSQPGQRNHHGHHQNQRQHQNQHYYPQYGGHAYGMKQHHGVSQRSSPAPAPLGQQQYQPQPQVYGQLQQCPPALMAQQQPSPQQSTQQVGRQLLYGMGSGSVIARSPDSFGEGLGGSVHNATLNNKFDGFSLNLSSSISSGAGSTSSYSSFNEYELQNKLPSASTPAFSPILENNFKMTQEGTRSDEINAENENNGFESFGNVTNNSNRGWLNIWGNDMSVWV